MKTSIAFIALSVLLGSVGLIAHGCKSKPKIYVIDNKNVVTNTVPAKAFNDEQYVWENFNFSTNRVINAR